MFGSPGTLFATRSGKFPTPRAALPARSLKLSSLSGLRQAQSELQGSSGTENAGLSLFYNLYFVGSEAVQLVNHSIDFAVGGFDGRFQVEGFLLLLKEIFFPFGFVGKR